MLGESFASVPLPAARFPKPQRATMSGGGLAMIDGERTTGQDVRTANVTAVMAIGNIVKSSLGPVGLDKVLVL